MERTTRRRFLLHAGAACCTSFPSEPLASLALKSEPALQLSRDPRRPQFHLLPAQNWMNDPNGPIFFSGKYHMFFQYNPKAAVWGNMSWNHAISDDMIHWTNYPVALTMTPGGPDAAGCFSGSTIACDDQGKQRVYAIYTGVVRDDAHQTIRSEGLRESQCIAWSDDPLLRQWTKLPTPIIPDPPAHLAVTGFRDPSVWKHNQTYFMTVGSGIERVGGCVLLYRSNNLMEWEYLHPLTSGTWNGVFTPNPVRDGEMWECPDFFPLGGDHVLVYSTMGKVFWQSGFLDETKMNFEAKKSGLLDLDAFYAPKTQLDAQGRRILWGWIPERRSLSEMTEAGWSGMMSLPKVLNLDRDGSLRMEVIPQTQVLRSRPILQEKGTDIVIRVPNATGEVLCTGSENCDLKFAVLLGNSELSNIRFLSERHILVADGRELALTRSGPPKIHAFIDGSVIEMVLNDRIGYTKRFYYAGPTAPGITVRASGPRIMLNAWELSPITTNRLTTVDSVPFGR